LRGKDDTFKVEFDNSTDEEISSFSRRFKRMLKQKGEGNKKSTFKKERRSS